MKINAPLSKMSLMFVCLVITTRLFSEQVPLSITEEVSEISAISLTLDKALELASKNSFEAIEKEHDLKLNKIDELKQWYSYIPRLIYKTDMMIDTTFSELGGAFGTEENKVNQKLAFSQKLFGSDLITIINENRITELARDVIETEFNAELRYYVRNLYTGILVNRIKENYITDLLTLLPPGEETSTDIFALGDSEMRISLQEALVDVQVGTERRKRALLNYLRLDHIDNCTLTSTLQDVEAEIQSDYTLARQNSIRIKLIEQDLLTAKNTIAQGITGFLPQIRLNYNYAFYDDLDLNLSFDLNKSGFGANIGLERDALTVDGVLEPTAPEESITGGLSGSITFDSRDIFDAATDTAKNKVNLKKVELRRDIEEAELFQLLRNQLITIEKEKEFLDYSKQKVTVYAGKRKAFEKLVEPTSDSGWWFFEQYMETTEDLLNQVQIYFNSYYRHFQNINYYYYIVDGGTSSAP